MIKSIRLQNFFGFQDCTINLERGENALVGINGSGKSNFFKAIKVISNGITYPGLNNLINKTWGGIDNIISKHSRENNFAEITLEIIPDSLRESKPLSHQIFKYNIKFERIHNVNYRIYEQAMILEKDMEKPIYSYIDGTVTINESIDNKENRRSFKVDFGSKELYLSTPQDESRFPNYSILHEELSRIICYSEFDTTEYSDIRRALPPVGEPQLEEDGSNLVQVLNLLKLSDRDAYNKICKSIETVNANFEDIEFRNFSNKLELHLLEKNLNSAIPPQSISDGTLRFLCLMAILYNPNRGSVICIDEPELGLHPDMIHTLYEAIKYAAQTSQIIISTHSPLLLDWFDFENVRVFEKDENNAAIVKQLDREHYKGWYDTYMLGDMWLKGDIGGKRW